MEDIKLISHPDIENKAKLSIQCSIQKEEDYLTVYAKIQFQKKGKNDCNIRFVAYNEKDEIVDVGIMWWPKKELMLADKTYFDLNKNIVKIEYFPEKY
jgi:hypothetical protein